MRTNSGASLPAPGRPRSAWAFLLAALLILAGLLALDPARAAGADPGEAAPGVLIPITVGPDLAEPTIVPRPPPRGVSAAAATFQVNYDSGFSAEAQAAFQAAVDIWAAQLTSPVPIVVNASFATFGTNVLGSAGATTYRRNFTGAPQANTFYPSALANKLAGSDLDPAQADIQAQFSSGFANWYFGNGTTPVGKINFTSVVLHELGHGLGFVGSAEYASGVGRWGLGTGAPFIYDRFEFNGGGQQLISAVPNTSTALGSQYTGGSLFFNGTNANTANGGNPPRLYAPNPWEEGSSISHLDEATYAPGDPNSLMTPAISPGETIYDPGPITRGIFADMGWTITAPGASPSPTPSPSATPSPTSSPTPSQSASPSLSPTPSPTPSPSASPSPSPVPTTPTFADVPTDYWAYAQIQQFASRGITTGCGNDDAGKRLYCPERGVTRAEMAVFIMRTLGTLTPTAPATATFADVPPSYWAYAFIEEFAKLGITTGCGVNELGQRIYCPDRGVTRAEMAVFIDRAKGQTELKPATPTFADVPPSYWAYGFIERFFTLGITTGCGVDGEGKRIYCPDRGVTRAEMAVFSIRAYP